MLIKIFAFLFLCATAAEAATTCDALNDFWATYGSADFRVTGAPDHFTCPSEAATLALAMLDLYRADNTQAFYRKTVEWVRTLGRAAECEPLELARAKDNGDVLLCPRFFSDGVSREQRSGTLYHEAAHLRRGDPGHRKCDAGDQAGKVVCDETFTDDFAAAGANSLEALYYFWLLDGSDSPEVDRLMARNLLRSLLANRFNTVPSELRRRYRR